MIQELASTRDGDFILDVMSLSQKKTKPTSDDFVMALNRHGLKPSEANAIMQKSKTVTDALSQKCV